MDILHLNDDCLWTIFTELDLLDLLSLKKTCTRFEAIACDILRRQKFFDFSMVYNGKTQITTRDASYILEELGCFLEHLSITRRSIFKEPTSLFTLVSRHCSNLKRLEVHQLWLRTEDFKNLNSEKLECLSMNDCSLIDNGYPILANTKVLQRLDLSYSICIAKRLVAVENLKWLSLRECGSIEDERFVALIDHNKTLEYLNILGCRRLTRVSIKTMVTNLVQLTHLVISVDRNKCDDPTMSLIGKLPNLKKLLVHVNGISRVQFDLILRSLVETNQLEHLEIMGGSYLGLAQFDYNMLCDLRKLKELILNCNCYLNNSHMAQLATKDNFTELHVLGCFAITDDALIKFLQQNPHLQVLNIGGRKVTDTFVSSVVNILKIQAQKRNTVTQATRQLRLMVDSSSVRRSEKRMWS